MPKSPARWGKPMHTGLAPRPAKISSKSWRSVGSATPGSFPSAGPVLGKEGWPIPDGLPGLQIAPLAVPAEPQGVLLGVALHPDLRPGAGDQALQTAEGEDLVGTHALARHDAEGVGRLR